MKKNFNQIFSTIEIDPVTDKYHITIPEEIINELDWYEEMVLKWNIENDDVFLTVEDD
jgi:bifunctional DNA-binding transcriptional regulator/antitoxin component of YhaV-PrlF toxin-antitoxin module